MNKSELKAIFINAKATDAKYIGVSIQTEGSSQPEIIINPNANFDAKFDYYMEAYDDDLILIAARPSMGKTAFALNVVQNVAIRAAKKVGGAPKTVAFFSLEMSKEQLESASAASPVAAADLSGGVNHTQEAVAALMVLGYTQAEALHAMKQIDTAGMEADEIIRQCLKKLVKQ